MGIDTGVYKIKYLPIHILLYFWKLQDIIVISKNRRYILMRNYCYK